MSNYELLTVLTSLLSVVVASVALYRSHRVSARQIELEETQAAFTKFQHDVLTKEQETKQRADVRLAIVDGGNRLAIENIGAAVAKDVVFELIMPDNVSSYLIDSEIEAHLPVTLLPGQAVKILIAPTLNNRRPCLARIAWIDARGEHQQQSQTLTF